MAEQAFLDREEENLRNRRQELMKQEQMIERTKPGNVQSGTSASSSGSDSGSDSSDEHLDVFKSFVEQSQSSSFMENSNEFYSSHNNGSSSGENTAIFINKAEMEPSEKTSLHDDSGSEHNQHLSSSNLQFPTASRTPTESEAAMSLSSRGVSDSEESWDVFSENEWNARNTDNES
jgi:Tfp pilus assembly protein FimT